MYKFINLYIYKCFSLLKHEKGTQPCVYVRVCVRCLNMFSSICKWTANNDHSVVIRFTMIRI